MYYVVRLQVTELLKMASPIKLASGLFSIIIKVPGMGRLFVEPS